MGAVRDVAAAERARAVVGAVVDPELPMLTLADLGVLRSVEAEGDRVVVTITPTYTGCPAMATIRSDLRLVLAAAGFADVEVRTTLSPAWSTDWISEAGRRSLHEHGIAPPGPVGQEPAAQGPVALQLLARRPEPDCPRCGSPDTEVVSRFGASPCTSQHRCRRCAEPFDKVKEL